MTLMAPCGDARAGPPRPPPPPPRPPLLPLLLLLAVMLAGGASCVRAVAEDVPVVCRDLWTTDVTSAAVAASDDAAGVSREGSSSSRSSGNPVAGFRGGWRAKAVRYVPRPIGGRASHFIRFTV